MPYTGEIRMFAGSFAPAGWAFCDGQLMPISENDALFILIGTTYGGDGEETFALPNLQSRVPIHMGTSLGTTFQLGEAAGVESVTLTTNQIPSHTHPFLASTNTGVSSNAQGNTLSSSPSILMYIEGQAPDTNLAAAIGPVGGSQPHDNFQPFTVISFIISLYGQFPTQN
jgi:microcystin-dependent protein